MTTLHALDGFSALVFSCSVVVSYATYLFLHFNWVFTVHFQPRCYCWWWCCSCASIPHSFVVRFHLITTHFPFHFPYCLLTTLPLLCLCRLICLTSLGCSVSFVVAAFSELDEQINTTRNFYRGTAHTHIMQKSDVSLHCGYFYFLAFGKM